ncbi:cupin domain-containing protein [Pseudoprimorskyibacter insulae]|uniref:DUF985 domain-containing protein n=1 Tax=Pseudoprimorskyibacter insulae TaxID=1695997 RepID=A0A2R8AXM1_9RHOB|nr:cupin domain-containing protein [Pseudoprimorskyibacter insulae]SPF80791.1 hypothetical protein PRI8871_02603 [Pseudoprimorskyibacter insulae]
MTADELIAHFDLSPHPEGGHYRQTWIADEDGRPSGTCIYFLLKKGERSHWHKVDATEIWHYYAGAPLILHIAPPEGGKAHQHRLGIGFGQGEAPQAIVPLSHWQAAETTGEFTLVGCTVSPGFQFSGFTLAQPDFDPTVL